MKRIFVIILILTIFLNYTAVLGNDTLKDEIKQENRGEEIDKEEVEEEKKEVEEKKEEEKEIEEEPEEKREEEIVEEPMKQERRIAVEIPGATQQIEEGTYEIYFSTSTKVVDVNGSSKENDAKVTIYERGNQNNQKFRVELTDDGKTYSLTNVNSGKVLDATGGGIVSGANVCQYAWHGGDNQRWYIKEAGDGTYYIISKVEGLYLDVVAGGAGAIDGKGIEVYKGHGGTAQKFKLVKVLNEEKGKKEKESGIYRIYSEVGENRLIEIPNNEIEDDKEFKIGEKNNIASEKFEVEYNEENGTYTITVLHSGKALDVRGGSGRNGAIVQQHKKHGLASQQWIMIKHEEDDSYSFISKANGLALDVCGNNATIGTEIEMYQYHGGTAQRFKLEECNNEKEKAIKTLENSTYRILSVKNNKEELKIDKEELEIWENTRNSIEQKFEIESDEEGYYKIKSKKTGEVLTVESENPEIGSTVTQKADEELDTQKWVLKKYAKNVYGIVSKCGNLYISTEETLENGQKLKLRGETDLVWQQFIFVNEEPKEEVTTEIETGVYQIATVSNTVLDITGGSYSNAANALIWNNTEVQQQKYYIERIEETNYYKIIATHSAKGLDVETGATAPGANIIQYDYAGNNNQQWIIKESGEEGYYNIVSRANGLCLDIASGQTRSSGSKCRTMVGQWRKWSKI